MTEAQRRANKRWRERHPEKWYAYHAQWQRENADKFRMYTLRSQMKKHKEDAQ